MPLLEAVYNSPSPLEFRGLQLKRRIVMMEDALRLSVLPNGDVASLSFTKEKRILYGKESIHFFKVQAGVKVPAGRVECVVALQPGRGVFSSRVLGAIDVKQEVQVHSRDSPGFTRTLRISNTSRSAIQLNILSASDPTGSSHGPMGKPWSIGVNAFNRGDYVVMDEVADGTGVRVAGSRPAPRAFFMTREIARVAECLERGELPDGTAGMTGPLLILSQHEVNLEPASSAEITYATVYNSSELDEAVSEFKKLVSAHAPSSLHRKSVRLYSSDTEIAEAFNWSAASLLSSRWNPDLLDALESLPGVWTVSPELAVAAIEGFKMLLSRKGCLPHSSDPGREGLMETALFVLHGSRFLRLASDKKLTRKLYTALRKSACFLSSKSGGRPVSSDVSLPQGWRRRLAVGFPTGTITEVNLTVNAALVEFADLARDVARAGDSLRFRREAGQLSRSVMESLVDPSTGTLALNQDPRGTKHWEETVDQVVGMSRLPLDNGIARQLVHRLLEKDFETGFGPRTVPTSNQTYFSESNLEGQLGGYWPRAALAHALLAFKAGLPQVGSPALAKIALLVSSGVLRFGSPPGEFPFWIDLERSKAHGGESDAVAASRLVECVVSGELRPRDEGTAEAVSVGPRADSSWHLLLNGWNGEAATILVARREERELVITTAKRASAGQSLRMGSFEMLQASSPDVVAAQFSSPGQIVCFLNPTSTPHSCSTEAPLRDSGLAKLLSAALEEFDPATGQWFETSKTKVLPKIQIRTILDPHGWRVFRLRAPSRPVQPSL